MQMFPLLLLLSHVAMVTAVIGCHGDRDKDHRLRENCTAAGFSDIPAGLEPTTKVLLFPRNLFPSLSWSSFQIFADIYEIDLTGNKVSEVTPSGAPVLTSLSVLRLGQNRLTSFSDGAFAACPALSELYLGNNDIRSLSDHTFSGLNKLEILDLSFNHISVLPALMLHPLSAIETLYLQFNKIRVIPDDWFSTKEEVPYLYFSDNPWTCSCSLGYLHRYLNEFEFNFYVLAGSLIRADPESLVCDSPSGFRGRTVLSLEESDLCSPDLEAADGSDTSHASSPRPPATTPAAFPTTAAATVPSYTEHHTVATWSWTSFFEWSRHSESRVHWSSVRSRARVTESPANVTPVPPTKPATTEPFPSTGPSTTTKLWLSTTALIPSRPPAATMPLTAMLPAATTPPPVTPPPATTPPPTTTPPAATTTPPPATMLAATPPPTTTPPAATTTPPPATMLAATPPAATTTPPPATTPPAAMLLTTDHSELKSASVFCFWLFAACALLCVASAACTLTSVAVLTVWFRRGFKPLREAAARRGGSGEEGVRLLTHSRGEETKVSGDGGEVALYRSVLFVHRERGEVTGEEDGTREGEKKERLLVALQPTGSGEAEREDGEDGGRREERGVYRKTLYRLFCKEEAMAGWRDVMEDECRAYAGGGGGGGGGGSRKRYSVILREERGEPEGGREEVEWVVGGWEVKGGGGGEGGREEERSSWGEWLSHYLPSMPWGVSTPPEGGAAH